MNVFDISVKGRKNDYLGKCDTGVYNLNCSLREKDAGLPELDELSLVRHYTKLSKKAFGVDDGFYPLGSCTMKYNPKLNEAVAALPGFTGIHPLQDSGTDGAKEVLALLGERLKEITGMDAFTIQPAAGAHGEYVALQMVRAYHRSRKDFARTKVIIPDSAHGTNPASAAMTGFSVVNIPSDANGCVDLDALKSAVSNETAALMLTNPNTLGIFDKNIAEIAKIVHVAGGLLYYDGANLNPIMGVIRPGDTGFDLVHLNLHKTFSTPHGGGGPGSGPVGCKAFLKEFLPSPVYVFKNGKAVSYNPKKTIGRVKTFDGNFLVAVRALAYIETLGSCGIREAAQLSVLNANYLMNRLKPYFPCYSGERCMHEFVISCEKLKEETGVSALDFAKALIDAGIHPPTMYFPLIVHEALMFEPTETESRETIDAVADAIIALYHKAYSDPESFHNAPLTMPVSRPDEVNAARNPVVKI